MTHQAAMRQIVMPHWSATRFMLFEQCPQEFRDRYVDGIALESTEAMSFGSAVHKGLEAHFNGGDGERLFRTAWKEETAALVRNGKTVAPRLSGMGIELLNKVVDLGLKGTPERGFSLDTNVELGAPIIGAMDLYDPDAGDGGNACGIVYDFKTTRGRWSQERAQSETWQPLLYTWAAWEFTQRLPAFEYVVLNRITGALDRFRRQWSHEEWLEQMNNAWKRMCHISVAVATDRLECLERHGQCQECGERWDHAHDCSDVPHSKRIRVGGR